jgi:hypothetical protein
MQRWQLSGVIALAALPVVGFGQVKIKLFREYTANEKSEIRMEFERIEGLPPDQQARQVPRIYRDMYPFFLWDYGNYSPDVSGPLSGRCLAVLDRHRGAVRELVAVDLRNGEPNAARHALDVAAGLKLTEAYDDVAAYFRRHDGEPALDAAKALGEIGDPRAIRLLMEKDSRDPMRYSVGLILFYLHRRPDAAVLKCLHAENAETRWRAIGVLTVCNCEGVQLIPEFERLIKDADSRVRIQAGRLGFALAERGFRTHPSLVTLLSDRDTSVRVEVACMFAEKNDSISARVLLELVQGGRLEYGQYLRIVNAVASLSSIQLDQSLGGWKLTTERSREAMRRYTRWVESREKKET